VASLRSSIKDQTPGNSASLRPREFLYKSVALGGTFDVLHCGHHRLFSKAFALGNIVFIGVSGDRLVAQLHKRHSVRPYRSRTRDLRRYLKSRGWLERARIVELRDSFGPATRRKRLEALVVSEETRGNGRRVNFLRRIHGLSPLRLYVVRLVKAEDGEPISATRIRRGEIDAEGKMIPTPSRRAEGLVPPSVTEAES
jgi:cytidyltransferase-like protein